ncbi:MAG TPA: alpha/beta fold hydrolase [Longimicrobium sp.]|nr:alpha/beta fold hydrolase [Longimicrobium sp.]
MKKRIVQNTHEERAVPAGRRIVLDFRAGGEAIPGILLLPKETPAPGVLLLHGYSSRKEHMAQGVGQVLQAHGIATLAIDLPLHGTRGDPLQAQAARNPLALMGLWRQALRECRLALRYLEARAEVDAKCIGIAGYSLGSFLAVMTAADDPAVRAVVLAAGGDLPAKTPLAGIARMAADPLRAVRKLDGRPLLMIHGRWDRTVTPDQARRLFEAAQEPRELKWWNAGHILPQEAIAYAGEWLKGRMGKDERE